ncbi:MAG: LysE family translocator [Crocinitomicaceae bacterium]|nr:LysE family translocator [Crocinitomicaceae bacterium]MDG1777242.1 LysE family translocator [Crocinitomicaceae bacterium]
MSIITGFLFGLSTLLFVGPVLFYLLKSTIESGFKAGVAVSLGILLGDAIYVALALFGTESLINQLEYQKWFALFGGIILLTIGLKYVLKPNLNTEVNGKLKNKRYIAYFVNGFLINFVNPFVFVVWLGFTAYNTAHYSFNETVVSLIVTLLVILATDILKSYFSNRLASLIKPDKMRRLTTLFGVLMVLFSIRLIVFFYLEL